MAPQLLPAAMVAGPCCVFGATAKDGPPDVVVGEGATSDGVASFDGFEEERGGTSSSEEDEELKITEIVSHRNTQGQPNDPVLAYYKVRFAGLEGFDEEMEDELPEEELLRRAPKLLRDYRREVGRAAAAATSRASEATSAASARPAAARRARGRGGGRARSRQWSREEVARVVQVGREQRHLHMGEAGFTEVAGQLGRTVKAVYAQWMRVQTPQKSKKRRASVAGGATGRARPKVYRETSVGRGVDDEVDGAGYGASAASDSAFELWKMTRENIALRAQVKTLRECLGLLGRRRSEHRGGGGGYGSHGDYGRYERSASRSPPRDRYDGLDRYDGW